MEKRVVIERILNNGVFAVIRAESKKKAFSIVEAVRAGGIKLIEVTMTVPGALDIIKELSEKYAEEDIVIGAGTVLDPETARACILAGAKYIVSPSFDEATIKLCNRYAIPVMPGIMTVKEAIQALELGVDILKVFPGGAFGPSIIKAFKGPLPQGNFMPTGGVNLENVSEWIASGAVAVGIGGELTKGASEGNYEKVTETARNFVERVQAARGKKLIYPMTTRSNTPIAR